MSRGRAAARRISLRRLISGAAITSQDELVERLEGEGFRVTQTTVSRDLAAIGAVKVATPAGECYQLASVAAEEGDEAAELARLISEFVVSIDAALNQVVLRTMPGGASAVAVALDTAVAAAAIDGVLGTLAGDDTVLVICRAADCREAASGPVLARRLRKLLSPEG
jgi:transcriptional regulator of arginine metabolism